MLKLKVETIIILFITMVNQYVGISSISFKNILIQLENTDQLLFLYCTIYFLC